MSRIDFVWPAALFLLLLVPLIALAMHRGSRLRGRADALYGGGEDLRIGRSTILRGLRAVLFLLALAVLIVGVARPRWGTADTLLEQRGIDVVLAVDVSRSMEAPDVEPSRAAAIVEGLRGMLAHMQGNRVGLVIFGETAFERSPLTLDVGAISTLLGRAQAESALVRPGSSLAVGIEAALEALEVDDPAHAQAIVVASDGEDLSGDDIEPALAEASERGVPVYSLFAGGEGPATLPEVEGREDVTTADRATMQAIADASGTTLRDTETAAGLAVEFRRMRQTAFASDVDEGRIERFTWFVGAGLVLLVVQALVPEARGRRRTRPRRGLVTAGAAGLFLVACSGTAVWQSVDSGNAAYLDARFDEALAHYEEAAARDAEAEFAPEIAHNAGNALHQLQRYDEAVERALEGLEAEGEPAVSAALRYALGNHYFLMGDLERARDAYIATLRLDPSDTDAKANLELVLEQLTPPEPPPGETPPPEGEPGPGEGEGEGEGEGQGEPGATPEPQPGEGGTPGEGEGEGEGQPGATPTPAAPGAPGEGEPGEGGGAGESETYEEALERLQGMLGELGEEITAEEAEQLLELYQRLNELDRLPRTTPNQGPPPR